MNVKPLMKAWIGSPRKSDSYGGTIPLPPEIMVSARQDRIHPSSGHLISSTPIRKTGFFKRLFSFLK